MSWFFMQKPEEVDTPEKLFNGLRLRFGLIKDKAKLEKEFCQCL